MFLKGITIFLLFGISTLEGGVVDNAAKCDTTGLDEYLFMDFTSCTTAPCHLVAADDNATLYDVGLSFIADEPTTVVHVLLLYVRPNLPVATFWNAPFDIPIEVGATTRAWEIFSVPSKYGNSSGELVFTMFDRNTNGLMICGSFPIIISASI